MRWSEDTTETAKRDIKPEKLNEGEFRSLQDLFKQAVKTKPSYPNLVDEYEPTDVKLWETMLEVASGDRLQYNRDDREVNSPNGSRGYRNMPHNPKGIAWAVKQYKGYGGSFRKQATGTVVRHLGSPIFDRIDVTGDAFDIQMRTLSAAVKADEWEKRLTRMVAGGVEITHGIETQDAQTLADAGLLRLASNKGPRTYWEITAEGTRYLTAGLKTDLIKKVTDLAALTKKYRDGDKASREDKTQMREVAKWFRQNFRVDSAKTPRGQKKLKESGQSLLRILETYSEEYAVTDAGVFDITDSPAWRTIGENIDDLVANFTAEGDKSKGRKEVITEIKGSHATYFNRGNISTANFKKFAARLDQIFSSLKGFHKKALTGTLKVAFVGAQQMKVQGKYRRATDEMWVKATPKVMARGGSSYGSPEYIIIHELGHRYENFNRVPEDFDRGDWRTTRYSFNDGESFAELFALSHFGIKGSWDDEKVKKFERVMTGKEKAATGVHSPVHALNWVD